MIAVVERIPKHRREGKGWRGGGEEGWCRRDGEA